MYNKVIYEGRLTKAPEMAGNQNRWVAFTVAQSYKTKDGAEETMFLDCTAMGTTGDYCIKYLKTGDLILVDGRLSVHPYQGKDGLKRLGVKVYADRVECLCHAQPKGEAQAQVQPTQQPQQYAPTMEVNQFVTQPQVQPQERTIPNVRSQGIEELSEDDLPF
nr:MAG TPA: Single stranded DNA binding protein [Caudoviricetes sp.]